MRTEHTQLALERLGVELQFTSAQTSLDGTCNWFIYYLWLGRAKFEFQAPGKPTASAPRLGQVCIAKLGREVPPTVGWEGIREEIESELHADPLASAIQASSICEVLLRIAELASLCVPVDYEWQKAALLFRDELDNCLNIYFRTNSGCES